MTMTTGDSRLTISPTPDDVGAAAARAAGDAIVGAIAATGSARVIFASAPSQEAMLRQLAGDDRIDWSRVHGLHMDEYVGIDPGDPRSFGQWLADRLPIVDFASFSRIDPSADAEREASRYEVTVETEPIDVTCLGIGANGHLAFNEPGSDFDDPRSVRVVRLTTASRQQQVDEGLFRTADEVPARAVTVTIPALLRARTVVATVLGEHKASAVAAAVRGPVTPDCPASVLRRHPRSTLHLDVAAAAGLE